MITKHSLIVLIISLFIACSGSNPYKKIEGFWVSVDYESGKPVRSLHIKDSIIAIDGFGSYEFSFNPEYNLYEPSIDGGIAFLISDKEDTLYQVFPPHGMDDTVKYIRVDSLIMLRDMVLSNTLPEISFPEADQENRIQLERKALVTNIYIGHLRKGILQDYPGVSKDSLVIQADHDLINTIEIRRFLNDKQSLLDEPDRDKLIVVLYADENTPMEMLSKIRQTIHEFNPKLTVYRAHIDWDERKFYYKAI